MTMLPFHGRCHTCGHDHDAEAAHWRDVLELAQRSDGMPASANERQLRRLLAARVSMSHTYFDDGEAQGQEHGISIDFMREPVADIDAKLRALNVARYERNRPAFNPAAECSPTLTQCPRCNNPHHACDRGKTPNAGGNRLAPTQEQR